MGLIQPIKSLLRGIPRRFDSDDRIPIGTVQGKYPLTILPCADTASEVNVISFTVPGGDWPDGRRIDVDYNLQMLQASGSTKNLTLKVKIGASSVTILSAEGIGTGGSLDAPTLLQLRRRGTSVLVTGTDLISRDTASVSMAPSVSLGLAAPKVLATANLDAYTVGNFPGGEVTGVDFSSDLTIRISAQWSGAHASTYYTVDGGIAELH